MNKTAETKPYQLITPLAIYNAEGISTSSKWILTEIFNLFKAGNKHCYASNGHFAEMFNLERANVSYHIQQLEKKGWIISKAFKMCKMEGCTLKDKGWHRHIIAGDTLSNILDSLSSKTIYPIKDALIPYQVAEADKNNIENNIENNNNVEKKFKSEIQQITNWAYKRALTKPSIDEEIFKQSVTRAISKHGYPFVYKKYSDEVNAIAFLSNIKLAD